MLLMMRLMTRTVQGKKVKYISDELKSYGYKVEYEKRLWRDDVAGVYLINVVATKVGEIEPRVVMELGAHYDTMASPGRSPDEARAANQN